MFDYVYGHDQVVSYFVASQIPHCRRGFGDSAKAIGIIDEDGKLVAGVVFHNWDPDAGLMEISGASLSRLWLTRETLRRIYEYPFLQCDCQMIIQRTPVENQHLLRMFAAYGYDLKLIPRLFGRDRDGVIALLTREAWESNKFNKRVSREKNETEEAA